MPTSGESPPLTRSAVLALAWPVVLAQAATAMTGVVDTAVMGNFGLAADLAAVAVGAVTLSFVYWGFGFLRMSTTGLVAQARGARGDEAAAVVGVRALILAAALGVGLVVAYPVIRWVALGAFGAEPVVEARAGAYLDARIPGAPAALMGFAISGWLLGLGRTRALLALQVVLNGVNAVLDTVFVAWLGWGAAGIGAGTAIAEWVALGMGLFLVRRQLAWWPDLFARDALWDLFTANRDIMVRTLALLLSFAWFVDAGARVGTAALAGNQVLMQFVSVSAFVLDAFAFITEKEVGEATGSGDAPRLVRALRLTTELALVAGLAFSALYFLAGDVLVRAFVADPAARAAALDYLPYCAVIPVLGMPAWQLDGAFLGATRGRALRNAAVAATVLYIATDLALRPHLGNTGVWLALLCSYGYLAGGLAVALPGLLASVRPVAGGRAR